MERDGTFRLVVVEETGSTNDVLLGADLSVYPLGTALLARRQTLGRGRAERQWMSEAGGLYLSLLFRPPAIDALALFGAYCVVRLCERYGVKGLAIRWPNDVHYGERKLAGILPQVKFSGTTVERAVLGVGLNVSQSPQSFPPELRAQVVTLQELLQDACPDVERVARDYLEVLGNELSRLGVPGRVPELCLPYLEGLAENAPAFAVEEGGEVRSLGRVAGLGPRGELLLDDGHLLQNLGPTERLRFRPQAGDDGSVFPLRPIP